MHNFLILNINKKIAKNLPYKGTVLDLGCGTSLYKDEILKVADKYIGVDWKNSFHNCSGVDVFANLSVGLPFKDRCADTIVSFQVMEHLTEPSLFLSECYRILSVGGKLFITVPFMWHEHEKPYDYFRYTQYGLEYLLKKNNFNDYCIEANTGFWQMWILKFNYHTKRFARGPFKLFWIPIWWVGQVVAPLLDKIDKDFTETASYIVIAKK